MKIHYYVEDGNAIICKVEGVLSRHELFEHFNFDFGRQEEYCTGTFIYRNIDWDEDSEVTGDYVVVFDNESVSFGISSPIPLEEFDGIVKHINTAVSRAKRIKEKCVAPEMLVLNFD